MKKKDDEVIHWQRTKVEKWTWYAATRYKHRLFSRLNELARISQASKLGRHERKNKQLYIYIYIYIYCYLFVLFFLHCSLLLREIRDRKPKKKFNMLVHKCNRLNKDNNRNKQRTSGERLTLDRMQHLALMWKSRRSLRTHALSTSTISTTDNCENQRIESYDKEQQYNVDETELNSSSTIAHLWIAREWHLYSVQNI
jgi:hypothetical protein